MFGQVVYLLHPTLHFIVLEPQNSLIEVSLPHRTRDFEAQSENSRSGRRGENAAQGDEDGDDNASHDNICSQESSNKEEMAEKIREPSFFPNLSRLEVRRVFSGVFQSIT